jgi:hypothetical protein
MRKVIFVPFPVRTAGTLATALKFAGDKPDTDTKKGRYKGFRTEERIFAPDKMQDEYQKTGALSELKDAEDQLYVTAHCLKGLGYVSTRVDCRGDNKVSVDDLVLQIEAHSLPKNTPCKIKLWICEGGLDDGANESFAKRFSRQMHKAGYRDCRIFGYPLSLLSNYTDGSDGQGIRKRAVKPEVRERKERLAREVELLLPQGKDPLERAKARLWAAELKSFGGDKDSALESIVTSEMKSKLMIGEAAAPVGARASTVRMRFYNGNILAGEDQ